MAKGPVQPEFIQTHFSHGLCNIV